MWEFVSLCKCFHYLVLNVKSKQGSRVSRWWDSYSEWIQVDFIAFGWATVSIVIGNILWIPQSSITIHLRRLKFLVNFMFMVFLMIFMRIKLFKIRKTNKYLRQRHSRKRVQIIKKHVLRTLAICPDILIV